MLLHVGNILYSYYTTIFESAYLAAIHDSRAFNQYDQNISLHFAESKRVDYLPRSGCRIPCICDTERNYFGYNGCNCQLFVGKCPIGTRLTLNGSCVDTR